MVHADASNFAAGLSKEEVYEQVLSQTKLLIEGQRNWVCNLANTSSLLWHAYASLPAPSNTVIWAGFYVLDPKSKSHSNSSSPPSPSLILGPFHGKVACQTIAWGRGVCGTAAATGQTQIVHDVDAWPGHIACDGESRSEIVVPVRDAAGVVRAVIDVDAGVVGAFDEVDGAALERLAEVLGAGCEWE